MYVNRSVNLNRESGYKIPEIWGYFQAETQLNAANIDKGGI